MTTVTLERPAGRAWWHKQGLSVLVVLYVLLAFWVSPDTYQNMVALYLTQAALGVPIVIVPALLVHAVLTAPKTPLLRFFSLLRTGGFGGAKVIVGFVFGIAAFSTLKSAIPQIVPFYADPILYQVDHFVHGGDPWIIAHAILPDWAEYPLASLYGGFWFMLWFGTLIVVAFWDNHELRARYLWAHALVVAIIGTVLALSLSSFGPIFTDRVGENTAYVGLLASLDQSIAGQLIRQDAAYLYASYQSGTAGVGTGISAMPSMHVALATLNACLFTTINRWFGLAGWAYVAVIMFGSVYFAWHYAVDGYVSVVVVLIIWFGVGRLLARNRVAGTLSAV